MKKCIILIFLVICMTSCSTYYVTRKPLTLMGSWQRTIKTKKSSYIARLTFNKDLTFSYEAKDPVVGHVNTYGNVSIISKKVAFLSDLQCKNAGIYKFLIEDYNTLVLTPERDLCEIRKSIIYGTWTRVE